MTDTKIRKNQISMIIITVLAAVVAIASRFDHSFLKEPLLSMSPLLTMELEILLSVLVVAACPIGIIIEKLADNNYHHFAGLHGVLFALSAAEWILLPVLGMQFWSQSPIVLGFSSEETITALHIWFYMTLLTYITMIDIYKVTGRRFEYYWYEHSKIANTWHICGKVWLALGIVFLFAFQVLLFIARVCTPSVGDSD